MFSGLAFCADCRQTMILHRAHTMDALKDNFTYSTYKKRLKDEYNAYLRGFIWRQLFLRFARSNNVFGKVTNEQFGMLSGYYNAGQYALKELIPKVTE
jgi:hypothetical protein